MTYVEVIVVPHAYARNVFSKWIQFDIIAQSDYAGSVSDDATDYIIEIRIPWWSMIGDFAGDLANGDADGNGRNVFPPQVDDVIEAHVVLFDRDPGEELRTTNDPGAFPWSGGSHQPLIFEE